MGAFYELKLWPMLQSCCVHHHVVLDYIDMGSHCTLVVYVHMLPMDMKREVCNICTGWLLTHWGRVTHICVSKLTIIGSDNGLLPDWRQAIIWTNAGILLIGPLGTNFSKILIEILTFSFKKMRLKVSSAKRRPFCLGLNVFMIINSMIAVTYLSQNESQWLEWVNRSCLICCVPSSL